MHEPRITAMLVAAIALVGSLFGAPADPPDESVVALDGQATTGRLLSVDATQAVVQSAGKRVVVPVSQLAEILLQTAPDLMIARGKTVLVTVAGEALRADALTMTDEIISLRSATLGNQKIPITFVKVLCMSTTSKQIASGTIGRCEDELDLSQREGADVLVIRDRKDDAWRSVPIVLKTIDERTITFEYADKDRTESRRNIPAIWIAKSSPKVGKAIGTLTTTDGSTLRFSALTITDKTLSADTPLLGKIRLQREHVAAVRYTSDRIRLLVDLKPTKVTERGFFKQTYAHRVNRSVGNTPLRMGGKTYETGLGTHSFCEITYQLDGAYSMLVTDVGIDDAVRPGGNATVTFLGADGKTLGKPVPVIGKDGPRTVRVDVKGVKTLTLRVDYGPDGLDSADHVDFGNPRLIK